MIQYIILLLPLASLGLYNYRENKSKESIIKSAILIVLIWACAVVVSQTSKENLVISSVAFLVTA